jgi:tetratricopeptide (TPR) repeat protein
MLVGLALAGGHLWAWHEYSLASTALDEDRFDDARRHLGWCLQLWPWSGEVRVFAACLERTAGNFDAAAAYLDECEKLHRPRDAMQLEKTLLRAESGDLAEPDKALEKIIAEGPPETNLVLEALARFYMREERLVLARKALDRWLEQSPNCARAWHWLGWVQAKSSSGKDAIASYQRALQLQPNRWRAGLSLANLFLDIKQSANAWPYLQAVQRSHPDEPELLVALAQYHIFQGEGAAARQVLDHLLQAHPEEFDGLLLFGRLECEAGRPASGEGYLTQALKVRPMDDEALFRYYRCLRAQSGRSHDAAVVFERYERARRDHQRLRELLHTAAERTEDDAELCASIAEVLEHLGNPAAVDWYDRALRKDPAMQKAHEALLKHFEQVGDVERAAHHREHLAKGRGGPSPSSKP